MQDVQQSVPYDEVIDNPKHAIRAGIIGDRYNTAQAAAAFNVTERTIYDVVQRKRVPYIKVLGVRYFTLDDLRRALVLEGNAATRGRGRPRKTAA